MERKLGTVSSDILGEVSEFEKRLMESHEYMEIRGKVSIVIVFPVVRFLPRCVKFMLLPPPVISSHINIFLLGGGGGGGCENPAITLVIG